MDDYTWIEPFLTRANQATKVALHPPTGLRSRLNLVASILKDAPQKLPSLALLYRLKKELKVHDLSSTFIFGRSEDCVVSVPRYEEISRVHFTVESQLTSCRLTDKSSNGTFVQGRRVKYCDLRSGDVITAGEFVFVYINE